MALGLDGVSYEIDLSNEHADELTRLLEPYLEAARKVGRKVPGRASSAGSSAPKSDPSKLQEIREWAKENGHAVSDRGRIAATVREAYDAAHWSPAASPDRPSSPVPGGGGLLSTKTSIPIDWSQRQRLTRLGRRQAAGDVVRTSLNGS